MYYNLTISIHLPSCAKISIVFQNLKLIQCEQRSMKLFLNILYVIFRYYTGTWLDKQEKSSKSTEMVDWNPKSR